MSILLLLLTTFLILSSSSSSNLNYLFRTTNAITTSSDLFVPADHYLLSCGTTSNTTLPGNRVFMGDQDSDKYLTYNGTYIQTSSPENTMTVPSPIYLSAKVFESEATYTFPVTRPGWHWIRLHFARIPTYHFDLQKSNFKVRTSNNLVLIQEFNMAKDDPWTFGEYIVNVTTKQFSVTFEPTRGSVAFLNALQFESAPDILINDVAKAVGTTGNYTGLKKMAYRTAYRLNVGGSVVATVNDTLGRAWDSDKPNLDPKVKGDDQWIDPNLIEYHGGESPLFGPRAVYATASQMASPDTLRVPSFNLTWRMWVDSAFVYLVRLHFCDIFSKTENSLYFNVYINEIMVIEKLDLTTKAGGLKAAYHADFVVKSANVSGLDTLIIQVGPVSDKNATKNAFLSAFEVLRMNNSLGRLDEGDNKLYGDNRAGGSPVRGTVAAVGFSMMFGAFAGLGAIAWKWRKRPRDWRKSKSFSSWLLPVHTGDASFVSSRKNSIVSRQSQFFSQNLGIGRYFSYDELREATKNWDSKAIVGVGGFGYVYLGLIDDVVKIAIKRGNSHYGQGMNEFHTEIQMLSKLRHRHLVSLIGYCDENSEMILVYEYMSNGAFRDHLYGKGLPSLSWKQRLEICIGAARGLHYLHTGAGRGIIHRDVKTTNILLDDTFVAKMADFGLSKNAPTGNEQTHVSTAVKGSFGYLDPEYFKKQHLTDKSDVYSFGVVLVEALCARPPIAPTLPKEQVNLAEWAMQWKRKGLLSKIIDPTLADQIKPESMKIFAEAAEKCLADDGVDRPTMGDVLWSLEQALQLQESSLLGKVEEEDNMFKTPGSSPSVLSDDINDNDASAFPVSAPEVTAPEAIEGEVQEIGDHSRTAIFSQFSALTGR